MEVPFLRVVDVARLLEVTPRRVYQLVANRTIPSIRMGRSLRIPRAALSEWFDQQSQQALRDIQAEAPCPAEVRPTINGGAQ